MPPAPDDHTLDDLRQQAMTHGLDDLSLPEIVALAATIEPAQARFLLDYFDGIDGLLQATPQALMTVDGIGPARALSICGALRLSRELLERQVWKDEHITIRRPADAARLLVHRLSASAQEELVTILLDARNGVLAVETVYIGSLQATVVRVGEIFRPAIRRNAAAIILAHNHPAGDPTPSPQDVELTKTLVEAGRMLDIPLIDHLVIGGGRWVSLREKGLGF